MKKLKDIESLPPLDRVHALKTMINEQEQ